MAQPNFKDPIVSAGPTLTGTGDGTLSVDKLTHFTVAQTYTLTCIAVSPDTLFSVVGSVDGPVGIATAGTQFFDDDLKIFLTITQGPTPFIVGDFFTVSVINGTDLNQDNIDDYDEQPQKNFGTGVKGTLSGDHSIRYSDDNAFASLAIGELLFTAVADGEDGNDVQVEYASPIAAIAASETIGGFLWTAVTPGAAGNNISVEHIDDVLAGAEFATILGDVIEIHLQGGVSTQLQVETALDLVPAIAALATYVGQGVDADPIPAPVGPTFLMGGDDAFGEVGDPEVEVTGDLITITFTSGKTTALEIKTAFDLVGAATALASCTVVGDGDEVQFGPLATQNLFGGLAKQFSFNQHEITDVPNFYEGNGSTLVDNQIVQGQLTVQKDIVAEGKIRTPDISDVESYIKRLLQDHKMSLRTDDHSKVEWSAPNFTFAADIVIDFNDTGFTNKIALADSPISIADGESLYVILDRSQSTYLSPLVASNVPDQISAFRVASRFGDNLILWDNTLIRDGKSVRIGEGGGEGGTVRVDLYDPISTTLPAGVSAIVDGISVTDGMLVLFSNLSVDSNQVYLVSGVGVALVWTPQSVWSTGITPVLGDEVLVHQGEAFALQSGVFDGSDFLFNDKVRYFNGVDYWEVSNLQTEVLTVNTTDDLFVIAVAGSENVIVDFSVIRGIRKEIGTLHITSDGTDVAITTSGANLDDVGVEFSADILAGDLRVRYTADNSAGTPTVKYYVRRWSDTAGGPGGVPSYSGGSGSGAAGSNTQIQFNDGGNLGADADFTWDKTNNVLSLGSLNIGALLSATLNDNVGSPTLVFQYSATTYPFVIIEFSLQRNTEFQVGRMLIVNDGTNVSFSVDFVNAVADPDITFSVDISAGNVRLSYTSTSTGFNATMKYSFRRWA